MYASTQQRRSSWTATDLKYKGYSCESTSNLAHLLVSISILTVALTTIALIKAAPKLYQTVASHVERSNLWYSFFWAASLITSLYNSFSIYAMPGTLPLVFQDRFYAGIIIICSLILLDILIVICIPKDTEVPFPSIAYCCTCCCCCCCCSKQLHSKWIQTLALSSLLLFTQTVALSALPTILWAFVFPIETLAVITSFSAATFCVTALLAVLVRNIEQLTCNQRKFRNKCYSSSMQLLLIPIVILFLAIVILTSYIYLKFITSGIETNQVGGFIASFLPSALLTIIGWFVTKGKFFKQTLSQQSDSTRSKSQLDPSTELTNYTC